MGERKGGEERREEGREKGDRAKPINYLTKDASHMTIITPKTTSSCMYLCTPYLYVHMPVNVYLDSRNELFDWSVIG